MVAGADTLIDQWIDEQAGVPVDHSEPVQYPEHHLFGARAEYHPDSEIPLHITLRPPERVLEDAGGWEWLTETARLHCADSVDE